MLMMMMMIINQVSTLLGIKLSKKKVFKRMQIQNQVFKVNLYCVRGNNM